MASHRIIYISQEIFPYLNVGPNGQLCRTLPQAMQQRKYQVRTFMPDFGDINERRNQLHEVIRLSGMNIAISNNDHPLVVKVASMHPSRIQVYFIDNDDYFQKEANDSDSFGSNRAENDERVIFFARGTVDTAKKLCWEPDFFHVTGWISALTPLYIRSIYGDAFRNSRIIYSVMPENETAPIDTAIFDKLKEEGIDPALIEEFRQLPADNNFLHHIGIQYSDAVVFQGVEPDAILLARAEARGIPVLRIDADSDHAAELDEFYKSLQ